MSFGYVWENWEKCNCVYYSTKQKFLTYAFIWPQFLVSSFNLGESLNTRGQYSYSVMELLHLKVFHDSMILQKEFICENLQLTPIVSKSYNSPDPKFVHLTKFTHFLKNTNQN